jgi:hypothetical protein
MRGPLRRVTVSVLLFAVAASVGISAVVRAGDGQLLFRLSDPKGDDYGDGTLQYPLRVDMQPGDLDLVKLSALAQAGGTVFEATFARTIRQPMRREVDQIGNTLDKYVKLGFYTFNIDIYIDTDRIPGSGSTEMLPGRRATIAAANAWEKAICLTPRPYDARDLLRAIYVRRAKMELKRREGSVTSADSDAMKAAAEREIESSVFFPTVVSVNGPSIRFFVPDSFLGGPAKDTWSYVVAATGADIELRVDMTGIVGSVDTSKVPGLMIIPILPGKGTDNFGTNREGDDMQPDLIDIIVPPGMTQKAVLKDYDLLGGRPVALPGVIPADVKVK